MLFNRHVKAASLGVAISALVAVSAHAQSNKQFGLGQPATVDELPAGAFKDSIRTLPPQARGRALGILRDGEFPSADFEHMRVDPQGFILYVDPLPEEGAEEVTDYPSPSNNNAIDVLKLHSNPGSLNTLYVDFDGHILRGTVWNSGSGHAVLDMLPFNYNDSDPDTYTQDEVNRIAEAWRRVAEDFAPFDVDVTTEEPPYTTLSDGERYYGAKTAHALVTRNADRFGNAAYNCSCGGVAYLNAWGDVSYATNLNFNAGLTSNAMTISHETGHTLGLSHDGGGGDGGYYRGHGSGATSWGPIMGAPFGMSVVTWDNGSYPNPNNTQNDYAYIIDDIPFRTDDHADTILAAATPLQVTGGTNVVSQNRVDDPTMAALANKGIIEDQSDIDLFSMNVQPGLISLSIEADTMATFIASQGADLDIEAQLLDEFGTVLQTSNPFSSLDATISYNAPVAGTYYLEITGVGKAVNGSDYGYGDYGIVGQFYINGTVPPNVEITDSPVAPNDLVATLVGDNSVELDWTDPGGPPSANETGYRIYRSDDGVSFGPPIDTLPANSEFYADNNLGNGDYWYYVEVFNSVEPPDQSNTEGPVTVDIPTIAYATSEDTTSGSITSGNYLSTQSASGSETLREQHQGGKPSNRRSFLYHIWTVTGVTPGATVVLKVNASAPNNAENDDFIFTYSLNGNDWTDLGTVVNGGSNEMMAVLDPETSGTVWVRVVDSDPGTAGARILDTVSISEINALTGGDPGNMPPDVAITSPEDGTGVLLGEEIVFTGTADDFEDSGLSAINITWSSNPSGVSGGGASVAATLPVGSYVVTASATDSAGATGEDSINVTVTEPVNLPPVVNITSPADGQSFPVETVFSFAATAIDPENGDVSGSLAWTSSIDGDIGASTTLSVGVHEVTATATDSQGVAGQDSISVTVFDPSGPTSLFVSGLTGDGVPTGRGNKWRADVTVTVSNDAGGAVSGAVVSGSWSNGTNGSGSCTTNGSGICTISKNNLKSGVSSVRLTVTGISGSLPYDSVGNVLNFVTVPGP